MALPIRDGNQTLTTLSTIIVNSAHVPAHSVVSLGSQAITDIAQAVSGVELGPNTISALENISVTFGAGTSITIGNVVSVTGGLTNSELRASAVTISGGVYMSDAQAVIGSSIPPEVIQVGGKSIADSKLYPISVDSNGVQSISGAVTASISGTPSVTFGTAVITGSTSILNFPATQTTTFSAITGSVSILNLPATQSVTFTQASVTFGTAVVTGSVSVLNLPATQTVTFTQASTTFGSITGSVSVLNLPATQTVTFTQASVTFGTPVVTGSVSVLNFPSTQTIAGTVTANGGDFAGVNGATFPAKVVPIGFIDFGTGNLVHVGTDAGQGLPSKISEVSIYGVGDRRLPDWLDGDAKPNVPISGTVTVGASSVTFNSNVAKRPDGSWQPLSVEAGSGYVSARVYPSDVTPFLATVTVGNSVTIGSLPAISGTVTANLFGEAVGGGPNEPTKLQCDSNGFLITSLYRSGSDAVNYDPVAGNVSVNVKNVSSVTIGNSVTIGSLPAISGTVTANVVGYDAGNQENLRIGLISYGSGATLRGVTEVIGADGSPLPISGTVTANSNFAGTNGTTLPSNIAILGAEEDGVGNARTLQADASGFLKVSLQDSGVSVDGRIIASDGISDVNITATTDGSKNRLDVSASGTVTANLSKLASHASSITKADNQIQIIGGYSGGSPTNAVAYPLGVESTGYINSNLRWGGTGVLVDTGASALPVQVVSQGAVTIGSLPNSLSIVNSSSVTKANVQYTAIAGSVNPSDGAPTYTMRPIGVNSSGQIYIDANPNGQSVFSNDGTSHIFVKPTPNTSVTIGSLPAISGTVTANVDLLNIPNAFKGNGDPSPDIGVQISWWDDDADESRLVRPSQPLPISGTVTANVVGYDAGNQENLPIGLISYGSGPTVRGVTEVIGAEGAPLPISGTVTANGGDFTAIDGSVTIPARAAAIGFYDTAGNGLFKLANSDDQLFPVRVANDVPLPISGTVTANLRSDIYDIANEWNLNRVALHVQVGPNEYEKIGIYGDAIPLPVSGAISGTVTVGNSVTIGSLPSGALTTRFGSVTTASVAQLTSAVTNTSRKYLLAQNISAGTVTIGIGFSPTTTQGIQLPAGGGLTFDAFCPTGAVYWLGAVTGAAFSILEG